MVAWCEAALRRARADLEAAAGLPGLADAGWAAADLRARLAGLVAVAGVLVSGSEEEEGGR